jgi:hypothetical protein
MSARTQAVTITRRHLPWCARIGFVTIHTFCTREAARRFVRSKEGQEWSAASRARGHRSLTVRRNPLCEA